MSLFLKFKHWQIFLIWMFAAIQMSFFIKTDFWFISFSLYIALTSGWIYSIGKILNKNEELNRKVKIWWIVFFISAFPFGLDLHEKHTSSHGLLDSWIMVVSGIVGLIAISKIVVFSARSLKQAQSKKEFNQKEIMFEIFSIYFFIIGVWVLQPRLNKLMQNKL